MAIRRRLAVCLSLPLVLAFTVVTAPATVLAQGGAFKPAGKYDNTTMLGSFTYFDPQTNTNVFLFANRSKSVGARSATDETTLSLFVSANSGALNANCFLDDRSSDFNVASDVSSASLHKTIAQANPGCSGLPSDVTVDVSWTGGGPIQSTHSTTRFSCSGYADDSVGKDSNNAGPATFNITGLAAPVTAPASPSDQPPVFHFGSSLEHVRSTVPPDSCRGSIGRGAGRPTPAAGNYRRSLHAADVFSFSGGTFFLLSVGSSSDTSNPRVGPSSSTAETTLVISASGVGGCFVINSKDLTIGMSSASLHTSLTSSTPACNGGTNSVFPDPFPITASWVGTSPVATTRMDSQYSCLKYGFQTKGVATFDGVARVTVSMPGFSGVVADPGSVGTQDTRTHAEGTPNPGCFFRG